MSRLSQNDRFVNRDKEINIFTEAVRSIGDHADQLLTFYGVGGQGKTALCDELGRRPEKVGIYEPNLRKGVVSPGQEGQRQAFYLMLWIRNALRNESGVGFPAFDLAFELFWKELNTSQAMPRIDHPWWAAMQDVVGTSAGHAAESSFDNVLKSVLGAGTTHLPVPLPFLGPVLKRLGRSVIDYARINILLTNNPALAPLLIPIDETLSTLFHKYDIVPADQIEAQLASILASDLDAWRKSHPNDRFVVLVDGYENVLKAGGASDPRGLNPLDKAMRDLVAQCRSTLFVIFSREKLRWDKVDPNRWSRVLENREIPLGGLAHPDAQDFLVRSGVSSEAARIAMIDGASARDPFAHHTVTCYPIMLDLQVKIFDELKKSETTIEPEHFRINGDLFEGKRNELLARLLRNYPDSLAETLRRLAVPRSFNQALFNFTIDVFRTGLPRSHWRILIGLSIVQQGPNQETFTFHDVIRESLIAMMEDDSLTRETHQSLFEYFDRALQTDGASNLTSSHAAAAAEAFYHRRLMDPKSALDWWDERGVLFRRRGIDRLIEEIDIGCINIAAEIFGKSSTRYVDRLGWHGVNLDAQRRYAEAEIIYKRALAIAEESGEPQNYPTIAILNNRGLNLDFQGRHVEAEQFHRRALASRMKAYGPEHPRTATSLGLLGSNLDHQGRRVEAELLYWQALVAIGPKHHDAVTILVNLGRNLRRQGRISEAEHWLRNAVELCKNEFGSDNFEAASSLRSLGLLLDDNGKSAEAEQFLQRALSIDEKISGPDHPDTARSLGNLGANLSHLRKYAEAEDLLRRALGILGPGHSNTGAILNNLGLNLDFQDRYSEAEKQYREALDVHEKMLGPEHPDTASSLAYLGTNLYHQGQYERAEEFLRRALLIRERVFGPNNVETATSLSNLALNLDRQNRHAQAEPLHRRAFQIRKEELGPEHTQTAEALDSLATNLDAQGKHAEAEELRGGGKPTAESP